MEKRDLGRQVGSGEQRLPAGMPGEGTVDAGRLAGVWTAAQQPSGPRSTWGRARVVCSRRPHVVALDPAATWLSPGGARVPGRGWCVPGLGCCGGRGGGPPLPRSWRGRTSAGLWAMSAGTRGAWRGRLRGVGAVSGVPRVERPTRKQVKGRGQAPFGIQEAGRQQTWTGAHGPLSWVSPT